MTPVTPRIQWTPEGKPRITNGVQVLLYVSSLPFHEQALFFKRAINHLGGGLTSDDTFMLWLLRIARPQFPETPAGWAELEQALNLDDTEATDDHRPD